MKIWNVDLQKKSNRPHPGIPTEPNPWTLTFSSEKKKNLETPNPNIGNFSENPDRFFQSFGSPPSFRSWPSLDLIWTSSDLPSISLHKKKKQKQPIYDQFNFNKIDWNLFVLLRADVTRLQYFPFCFRRILTSVTNVMIKP